MLNRSKQTVLAICIVTGLIVTPSVFATEANGIIQEIRVCGGGSGSNNTWIRFLAFKVENKWFGTYADRYSSTAADYDNNIHTSIVLAAFSTKKVVQVVSNRVWHPALINCGMPEGNMLHSEAGQFISIKN